MKKSKLETRFSFLCSVRMGAGASCIVVQVRMAVVKAGTLTGAAGDVSPHSLPTTTVWTPRGCDIIESASTGESVFTTEDMTVIRNIRDLYIKRMM